MIRKKKKQRRVVEEGENLIRRVSWPPIRRSKKGPEHVEKVSWYLPNGRGGRGGGAVG